MTLSTRHWSWCTSTGWPCCRCVTGEASRPARVVDLPVLPEARHLRRLVRPRSSPAARAMADLDRQGDPVTVFRAGSAMFTAWCIKDPVRYQLLFQRTIPDFEPSAASMALAWESYQGMASALAGLGIVEEPDLDLWTAVQAGIADQQIANDPGGQRWSSQLDRAIDMFLAFIKPRPPRRKR